MAENVNTDVAVCHQLFEECTVEHKSNVMDFCVTDLNENETEESEEFKISEIKEENQTIEITVTEEIDVKNQEDFISFEKSDQNSFLNGTLEELADCDYLQNRQLAARKILEFLQRAGSNEVELQSVISVLCKLSEDEEAMVQFELVQHVPSIASYCQDHPHLQIVIRQQLIPYTIKLLNDIQVTIRRSGQSTLLALLEKGLVDQSQLIEWICPLIAQIVTCNTNLEELRVEDVSLMTKMIPLIEPEIVLKFFLNTYISLCCDPVFSIRKVCALGFGALCKVVDVDTAEKSLLPVFLNLCNDEMWGVRRACAEVFVDVAKSVTSKSRKEILPHIFMNLLTDDFNFVKFCAFLNLGAFIYTFADPELSGCSYENGSVIIDSNLNNNEELLKSQGDVSNLKEEPKINNTEKETLVNHSSLSQKKSDSSLSLTAKSGHIYLHVDNENVFNNFQFWRTPLPEIGLDIDIEDGKATNIHVRASILNSENISPASEIRVRIAPEPTLNSNSSNTSKMLVQTACINTLSTKEQKSLLDEDTKVLWSSFKESVLTFKTDESEDELVATENIVSSSIQQNSNIPESKIEEDLKMTPYDQNIVPPILLFCFISVVNDCPFEMNKSFDDERIGCVAYSLPAVALTLGRKYWPCIKNTCDKLARNLKWTVRRTIASSLHELAAILGYEITMSDLLPIFLDLFKDVDEVRLRLIQHLSDFLKHLEPCDRKQFLPLLDEFTEVDNDHNWRFRCAVAEQLIKTSELYDAIDIPKYFLPVACSLLHDKVSTVRLAAIELMAVLLKQMHGDHRTNSYFEAMLEEFDTLYRQAHKWLWRQTYVKLCDQMVINKSLSAMEFVEKIVPRLFLLAWDTVPNVKLSLIKCLVVTLLPKKEIMQHISATHRELLDKMLDHFKLEVDSDIKSWFSVLEDSYV